VNGTFKVSRTFKGRAILPPAPHDLQGEALVTRTGFNTYASFYTSIHAAVEAALCADSGNQELYGKNMTDKIICLPKTIGSTSAGAVWQRVVNMGVAPKAMLFSQKIDPLAAGGLVVADVWAGSGWKTSGRIVTVDQLGDEFLACVKDGDQLVIRKDGMVEIRVEVEG
jgi:predicted aconitase with swiveling domain